jgi:hypothetical protein
LSVRNYSNTAPVQALTSGVSAGAVVLPVTSTTGWPSTPFTLAMDRGLTTEEVCLCTSMASNSFTVTRGYDGTTAQTHNIGASVELCVSSIDYAEANAHANSPHVTPSLVTAKGDLLAASASGTVGRLPVGADGTYLQASSFATPGMAWGRGVARLSQQTGAGADFTTIDQNYSSLRIEWKMLGTSGGGQWFLRFQGDASGSVLYDYILREETDGVSPAAPTGVYAGSLIPFGRATDLVTPAGVSSGVITIIDYARATFHKDVEATYAIKTASVAGGLTQGRVHGWYRSAVAINRITLTAAAGSANGSSIFTLYGLP